MFEFFDNSDETVKTRFLAAIDTELEYVENSASAVVRSAIVASAVFILLLTFAAF